MCPASSQPPSSRNGASNERDWLAWEIRNAPKRADKLARISAMQAAERRTPRSHRIADLTYDETAAIVEHARKRAEDEHYRRPFAHSDSVRARQGRYAPTDESLEPHRRTISACDLQARQLGVASAGLVFEAAAGRLDLADAVPSVLAAFPAPVGPVASNAAAYVSGASYGPRKTRESSFKRLPGQAFIFVR